MSKVISLAAAREARAPIPHLQGWARCLRCQHEFQLVTPVGQTTCLCSQCGCDAHLLAEVITDGDQWRCRCGWQLFRIDRDGIYCPSCGPTPAVAW